MDELWSDDFEVLHWVVERFGRNGHSVEVGEALRVFPEEHYDSVRESIASFELSQPSRGRQWQCAWTG